MSVTKNEKGPAAPAEAWVEAWGGLTQEQLPLPQEWMGWINTPTEVWLCQARGLVGVVELRCLEQQPCSRGDELVGAGRLYLPAEDGKLLPELRFGKRLDEARPQAWAEFDAYSGSGTAEPRWEAALQPQRWRHAEASYHAPTWLGALESVAWAVWHDALLLREALKRRLAFLHSEGCEHYAALKLLPQEKQP